MNNNNQSNNNNDQLSDDSVNIDLNTAMRNHLPHTAHDNAQDNIQQDLTMSQDMLASEEIDVRGSNTERMTDSGTFLINQNNNIDSASIVQSVGHILRRARIAKGMSIDDVSRQLRISVQQVEAIEKEDFGKLPGRTFLRGFIRNYANLVQLDSTPLLQMLPESVPVISTYERTPLTNKQISFSSNREGSGNNRLIIIIILFAVILGAYFTSEYGIWNKASDSSSAMNNEIKKTTEKASVEIQLPLSPTIKNAPNTQTNKAPEPSIQINNEKSQNIESGVKTETLAVAAENKSIVQDMEKPAAASSDLGNLYFKFTADSWVKVVDGKGASVFEQLKKGGSEQMVVGKRPLSIVLGNASGVNLTYNDQEINIPSYKKQDGTARFTLK
ncbi:cytoskeleton protein RodZ [Nitrosomonas sp. Nm84]|uniref:helix-turn-helix domain-containing protein n=1 Tax=Nitrosomonas sp. Nm84 TaxID=200124 RepID=UPI000D75588B|nr:RodZ domain-containing protein [Nitrosomonas sp. Nm84]PXW91350.1 cytoskeleton protein RodZ [Nitrosomonas sp. Nm84]